ncbi:MAG: hypothetical protein NPIRA02_05110 [Nitrospirales bacterium]|nr:MAG: hypothetical protein NPIRA02_05110 [Nitrospirales bacterium]
MKVKNEDDCRVFSIQQLLRQVTLLICQRITRNAWICVEDVSEYFGEELLYTKEEYRQERKKEKFYRGNLGNVTKQTFLALRVLVVKRFTLVVESLIKAPFPHPWGRGKIKVF